MSSDLQKVAIGDVCNVGDGAHSKVKRLKRGVLYLTSKNIGNGKLIKLDKVDYISKDDFERLFPANSRSTRRPQAGDILMGIIGTFGNAYLYKESDNFGFSSSVAILRPNQEKLLPEFLYYVVSSQSFKLQHSSHNSGSVQGYTNIPTIKGLSIPLPTLETQRKIALVLKSLDEKISINQQLNQTLEQIAQAIFKSWFVDFEPVKANINALEAGGSEEDALLAAMQAISCKNKAQLTQLQTDNPEHYNQLRTTAELFPSAMQDSELGEIPEGWKANKVGEIATAKGGYAFKSKQFQEYGNPVVKIKNIDGDGYVDIFNSQRVSEHTAKTAYRFKLDDGNLIMAMTGATVGKVGIVVTHGKSVYLNQRVAKFESEVFGPEVSWFLYCLFKRREIFELITGASQGSAQANVSSKGIEATPCVVPPISLLRAFIKVVRPLFQTRIKNVEQNRNLASIRNCLLPKLLAGDIELDGIQ